MEERFENADEVCERLSISKTTLYRWIKQGIPTVKVGGVRRFPAGKVDRWIRMRSDRDARGYQRRRTYDV